MSPTNSHSLIRLSLKSQRFPNTSLNAATEVDRSDQSLSLFSKPSYWGRSTQASSLNQPLQPLAANRKKRPRFSLDQVIRGALQRSDPFRRRLQSYVDTYRVDMPAGRPVEIRLRSRSKRLVPQLQLLDARTNQVLLNDTPISRRAVQLVFTPETDGRYLVRVSSDRPRRTGNYTLRSSLQQSVNTVPPVTAPPTTSVLQFNSQYGYGLVNAAAAVGRAIGQAPFADVPFTDVALNNSRYLNGSYFWGVDRVKAPEVWSRGYTGQGVTVAVIDTGVAYDHPDLRNNIWVNSGEIAGNGRDDDGNGFIDDIRGWDFVSNDNDPNDSAFNQDVGHGTFISGLIAGNNLSRSDVAGRQLGVAPDAKIMPIRVLPALSLDGNADEVAAGIRYAVNNGADVINLSLGFGDGSQAISAPDPEIEAALTAARRAGVAVVIAAGNERQSGAIRPSEPAFAASRDLGIAVGAIEKTGAIADFSNPAGNRSLDYVVAPGADIFSTYYQPLSFGSQKYTYAVGSGTSYAAPYVAGIAALMLSANRNLTPAGIESILIATANPGGVA
jgi:subtilisin family serine protease